jgi:hypothetical protein
MDVEIKKIGDTLWLNLNQLAAILNSCSSGEGKKHRRYIAHSVDLKKVKILIEQFYESHLPTEAWDDIDVPFRAWWGKNHYCFQLKIFRDWWAKQIRDFWLSPAALARAFEELGLISHRVRYQGKGNAIRIWEAPFL